MNKLGNFHPTSLCDEPRLWWLAFLLYHRLLRLWFQAKLFACLCGLNSDSPGASTAFLANSRMFQLTFPLGASSNVVGLVRCSNKDTVGVLKNGFTLWQQNSGTSRGEVFM